VFFVAIIVFNMSIETEKQTLEKMIRLFCKAKHGSINSLCNDCSALLNYAEARLDHCPHGDEKPVCRKCPVHCYKPDMRERITEVMRFSGPRMLINDPASALRHLVHTLKKPS
jgi:hypothetical protein